MEEATGTNAGPVNMVDAVNEKTRLIFPTNRETEGLAKPWSNRRTTIVCLSTAIVFTAVVGWRVHMSNRMDYAPPPDPSPALLGLGGKRCMFCDQSPPELHYERSYMVTVAGEDVLVTPMTVAYNYELYDGQNLFTDPAAEKIPNLDFDYAVLGISGGRNLRRGTNESVSLDEVYLHHLNYYPMNMLGAEILTRDVDNPFMSFPEGYALHVDVGQTPEFGVNAHLLSNRGLVPVDGSLALARKHCNECFYAPGKGADCTPAASGTFRCCGDSAACKAGETCACATTAGGAAQTERYQLLVEFLVSREVSRFRRVDQWNLAAPSCGVNRQGGAVFEEYPPDSFCADRTQAAWFGGGALFHQVPANDARPYVRTSANLLAPAGGRIVWAVGHLHTGGVNITLRLNGRAVCTAAAVYGTDGTAANARNERNHLVRIEPCADVEAASVHFRRDDVLTIESLYYAGADDERMVGAGAGGEHKNVMSMMFLGVVFEGTTDYLTKNRTSFSRWNDFIHTANLN